jgi:hypothetical protein
VTRELVTADVAFLTHQEKFSAVVGFLLGVIAFRSGFFSAAVGFLSGVIAFCSGLIMTMTWLHCSATLGLNVNDSSFLLMLSLMIPAVASIVAPAVLKTGLPRIRGV